MFRMSLTLKRRGWCLFHVCSEAGLTAVQCGPVCCEFWYG